MYVEKRNRGGQTALRGEVDGFVCQLSYVRVNMFPLVRQETCWWHFGSTVFRLIVKVICLHLNSSATACGTVGVNCEMSAQWHSSVHEPSMLHTNISFYPDIYQGKRPWEMSLTVQAIQIYVCMFYTSNNHWVYISEMIFLLFALNACSKAVIQQSTLKHTRASVMYTEPHAQFTSQIAKLLTTKCPMFIASAR